MNANFDMYLNSPVVISGIIYQVYICYYIIIEITADIRWYPPSMTAYNPYANQRVNEQLDYIYKIFK